MVRTEAFAHLISDKRAAEITREVSRVPVKVVFRSEGDLALCLTMDPSRPEDSNLVNVVERRAFLFTAEEFERSDFAARDFRLIWSAPGLRLVARNGSVH